MQLSGHLDPTYSIGQVEAPFSVCARAASAAGRYPLYRELSLRADPTPRRVRAPVSQVDLAPTLLDLAGLYEPDDAFAGSSLVRGIAPGRALYSESYLPYYSYGWSRLHVIRRDGWEYIDAPRPELYHLRRDPRARAGGRPAP